MTTTTTTRDEDELPKEPQKLVVTTESTTIAPANDCDVVLDSIDTCVGCVEGVDMQHQFEEGLREQAVQQRKIAQEHGLSEAEAAMIRLQMLDGDSTAVTSTLPELDMMNLCGNDDTTDDRPCTGVVSPKDTSIETDQPADVLLLVDSTAKSRRSLMDVEEADAVNGEKKTPNDRQCAICKDTEYATTKKPAVAFSRLPCCEEESSTTNFDICAACMLVLTIATTDGASRVGHCPSCRSWIALMTLHSPKECHDMSVRKLETPGKCESCLQMKDTLIEHDPPTCDACFLGKASPLLYECEECHETQNIPHTLYRCQPAANTFGNEMSACNRCQKSTHWRLVSTQLPHIPAGDVPTEWGIDSLELARKRVQNARQGIAKLDLLGRDATGEVKEEGCYIL